MGHHGLSGIPLPGGPQFPMVSFFCNKFVPSPAVGTSISFCAVSSRGPRAARVCSDSRSAASAEYSHLSHGGGAFKGKQSADCWLQLCTDNCIGVPHAIWPGKRVAPSLAPGEPAASPVPSVSGQPCPSADGAWNAPGEAADKPILRLTVPAAAQPSLRGARGFPPEVGMTVPM